MEYSEVISICKSKGLVIDVYDYSKDEYFNSFDRLFQFGQGSFDKYKIFNVQPGLLVFNNSVSLNAQANYLHGYFIINFNLGNFLFTCGKIKDSSKLFNLNGLQGFQGLERLSSFSLKDLLCDFCLIYTFYHEFGHLIQMKNGLNWNAINNETNDLNSSFIQQKHTLEFDADVFSALCLSTHIYQYLNSWFDCKTSNNIEQFSGLLSGILLIYIMSFPSMKRPIYFKEHSHPHPILRCLKITYVIIDYLEQLIQKKGLIGFEIRKKNCIKTAFEVAEVLAIEFNLGFLDFQNQFNRHSLQLGDYVDELDDFMLQLNGGAVNTWNSAGNSG